MNVLQRGNEAAHLTKNLLNSRLLRGKGSPVREEPAWRAMFEALAVLAGIGAAFCYWILLYPDGSYGLALLVAAFFIVWLATPRTESARDANDDQWPAG